MKSINRFGKKITYSITDKNDSWLLVEEASDSWLHTNSKSVETEVPKLKPRITTKAGMIDLLIHFHCDKDDIAKLRLSENAG